MRYTYTLLTAFALATGLQAQTTALDFTTDDCDGTSHTLFAELDAGNVVILELVMMGCQPCVTAAQSLTADVLPNVSDPSRVKLYSIGFTNAIVCAEMNSWKAANGFTHTVFAGMSQQTTYYGGMGMPTIAVVGGGSAHTVLYAEQGHSASDNPAILAAIEAGLAASVGINEANVSTVTIHPNPVVDVLHFDLGEWTHARILDLQGREVLSAPLVTGKLDVSLLQTGLFVLQLSTTTGSLGTARFEKK
ncbi:MAG: T9SS type A sorting domain-containing protein [Flavobacteriales bacterium]|nr:T9SS type A sorting domain-containing protein [Flavobacteriales bacterium]MBP6698602.1 T9SS type A sorting domain-containing protein [Flavobacteriales bacterium]